MELAHERWRRAGRLLGLLATAALILVVPRSVWRALLFGDAGAGLQRAARQVADHFAQAHGPTLAIDAATAARFTAGCLAVIGWGRVAFWYVFTTTIVISLLRLVIMILLAQLHYRRPHPAPFSDGQFQPFVSVLVPAYNEEKVIGATITSLLRSTYRNYEIVVIDDGSKDGTLAAARQYEQPPRVRVITKENGGKSSALNLGIGRARGEIVIVMDADTVCEPDFIPYVLGHFRDPNVAAVSGNAKVGNRRNRMAAWQSIEYISSFNLDRRAYTFLNCVTVVPGAAGAWRRRDLLAVGGFGRDTLAEDAELTIAVRRLGRRIAYEDSAIAWTEAPSNARDFIKQRRRWSYGTLQVLWKHRDIVLRPRFGALGAFAFPSVLLDLASRFCAPILEVGVTGGVLALLVEAVWAGQASTVSLTGFLAGLFWHTGPSALTIYIAYSLLETMLVAITFRMDREPLRPLLWLPIQRIVMRWLLYYVFLASMQMILKGTQVGWGKLARTGAVLGPGRGGLGKAESTGGD